MPLIERPLTPAEAAKARLDREYHARREAQRTYSPGPDERRIFDNDVSADDDPREVLGLE